MQIGDLVICNCAADVWYRGKPGLLVGFSELPLCDPLVKYGDRVIRLAKSGLEVLARVKK